MGRTQINRRTAQCAHPVLLQFAVTVLNYLDVQLAKTCSRTKPTRHGRLMECKRHALDLIVVISRNRLLDAASTQLAIEFLLPGCFSVRRQAPEMARIMGLLNRIKSNLQNKLLLDTDPVSE